MIGMILWHFEKKFESLQKDSGIFLTGCLIRRNKNISHDYTGKDFEQILYFGNWNLIAMEIHKDIRQFVVYFGEILWITFLTYLCIKYKIIVLCL